MAWTVHKDKSNGRKYYFNKLTKKTTWKRPDELGDEEGDDEWYARVDRGSGRTYYIQVSTRKTTWKLAPGATLVVSGLF